MKYYKYMKREYLEGFFETGALKIGTLYGFRDIELGNAIGDVDEAKHRYLMDYKGGTPIDMSSNSPEATFLREQGVFGNEAHELVGSFITIEDKVTVAQSCPDMYVFCMTNEYDPVAMVEFGYDSCFEVVDIDGFLRALTQSLGGKGQFAGLAEVTYKNRENSYTVPHDVHPAMMKGVEYGYQKEVRALWFTPETNIEGFIVLAPITTQYCRKIE
ncbi:hypothetical protein VRB78_11475 [Pseudomonas trivialis]|uniref:hypothetical protein n=1 Tax=Pseudomonas trivialis TaxID=200450 RepID=UPI0030D52B4A